jgi:hypothetical protein
MSKLIAVSAAIAFTLTQTPASAQYGSQESCDGPGTIDRAQWAQILTLPVGTPWESIQAILPTAAACELPTQAGQGGLNYRRFAWRMAWDPAQMVVLWFTTDGRYTGYDFRLSRS